MLERKLGFYEHSLFLQPGRLVPHFQVRRPKCTFLYLSAGTLICNPVCFQVDVYIYEPKGIASVETPNTLGEQFAELIKVIPTKDKVRKTESVNHMIHVDFMQKLLVFRTNRFEEMLPS